MTNASKQLHSEIPPHERGESHHGPSKTRSLRARCQFWLPVASALALVLGSTACDKRDEKKNDGSGGGIDSPVRGTEGGDPANGGSGTGGGDTGDVIEIPTGGPGNTAGTQPGGEVCASIDIDLRQEPTKLMLVLDKSKSMVDNKWDHDGDPSPTSPAVTRWHSLHEVVQQVTEKFNSSISFGAQLYPTTDPAVPARVANTCSVDAAQRVPIAAGAGAAVMAALPAKNSTSAQIKGATPTHAAYVSALEHLRSVWQPAGTDSKKKAEQPPAVVLVTDGAANCANLDDEACLDKLDQPLVHVACNEKWFQTYDNRIHTAVTAANSEHGIKTYVIGIGINKQEVAESAPVEKTIHDKLNELAAQGGTARPDGDTKYFSADNQVSLLSALDAIAASVQTCSVKLDTPVAEDRADYVEITIKGKTQKVPALGSISSCDGQMGWRWDHSEAKNGGIELCGSACDELKTVAAMDVVVGCAPPL